MPSRTAQGCDPKMALARQLPKGLLEQRKLRFIQYTCCKAGDRIGTVGAAEHSVGILN